MKNYIHILFLLAPLFCCSQEVVSSGGDQFSNSEGSFSFTVGEPVIETFSGSQEILTQGFQQNYEQILAFSTIPYLSNFSVYPNPFSEVVTILFSEGMDKEITISLHELDGKLISIMNNIESGSSGKIELLLTDLPDGMYFLNILISNDLNSTYRVVKTN